MWVFKVRSSFTLNRIVKKPLVISITNGFLPGEITRIWNYIEEPKPA
ncbi:hypothetical protein VL20_3241 [Microcystis panniformis FACHB-1757]|uniref:Uncharacterized protein n=1 Tax=Microcystis panniformis FACHB-1757 TaxID=1638788 RepID=A0A0K1S279_9CHRO|nr:hypothetical protein VL20_3241 [Microcystis panniformis FACHB-1757]